jgi:hypothetical protein
VLQRRELSKRQVVGTVGGRCSSVDYDSRCMHVHFKKCWLRRVPCAAVYPKYFRHLPLTEDIRELKCYYDAKGIELEPTIQNRAALVVLSVSRCVPYTCLDMHGEVNFDNLYRIE